MKTAPANGGTVVGTSATLQWGASAGATSYAYCVATTSNSLCDGSWFSTGASTSATVSGLSPSTSYYWQVWATNGVGGTFANGGAWWSFTTQAAQPALPGAFSKSSPSNGSKNRSQPVALSWALSADAVTYEYCVSTTSGTCPNDVWTSTNSATSASVDSLASRQQYFWQVRARNGTGTTNANGGSWWRFRTS